MASKSKALTANTTSVSTKILSEFIEVIISDSDVSGVGERLKDTLLNKRDFSESALRQALFGDVV